MYIFVFIIVAITLIFSYKTYVILTQILNIINTYLCKKSFDNTDIVDMNLYKDFFDIDNPSSYKD